MSGVRQYSQLSIHYNKCMLLLCFTGTGSVLIKVSFHVDEQSGKMSQKKTQKHCKSPCHKGRGNYYGLHFKIG